MFTDSALTTLNHHLEVIDGLAAPFQNRALLVLYCANAALAKIAADGAESCTPTVTVSTVTSTSDSSALEA